MNKNIIIAMMAAFITVLFYPMLLKASDDLPPDLTELTLEELMDIEITSVARKPQKLSNAAAAVFVITNEDIRRSGVTSIAEALRMVPGLEVAKIDASKWAISSRGFNSLFANKLLVLIDGRSVYTPLFSGVFWDVQDTLLEDIERIEVIRGPGASLWGANAVNGVINIITKKTQDSQGGLLTGGGGNEEKGFASVRYGGKLGQDSHYRIYTKYFDRDGSDDPLGADEIDDWDIMQGGFRIDSQPSEKNTLTLQGDIYDGDIGRSYILPTQCNRCHSTPRFLKEGSDVAGGNLLGRWEHVFSGSSDMALQIYYDRTEKDDLFLEEDRDTVDLDFQHQFALGKQQEVIWGLGYRFTHDDIENTPDVMFDPDSRWDHLFSAFLQDEITLVNNRLHLTLGSKLEYNSYTEFEVQPTGRLLWTPHERHSLWTSISRAVRTPSRAEEDTRFNTDISQPNSLYPGSPGLEISVFGDDDFGSEELLAYEIGYRSQILNQLTLDIAAFYNDYDNLLTVEPFTPFTEFHQSQAFLIIPSVFDNKMEGETYGVELAVDWHALDWWRFQAAYTYLQIHLDLDKDSRSDSGEREEGLSPHNQLSLRSSIDLPKNIELDLWFRYVDDLPNLAIDDYSTLDVRLGWKLIKNLELSLVGQNLLESNHPEFTEFELERGLYGKITWRF